MALAFPGTQIEAGKIYTVFAVGTVPARMNKLQAVWAAVDPSAPPAGKARCAWCMPYRMRGREPSSSTTRSLSSAWPLGRSPTTDVDAGVVNVKVKPSLGEVLILDKDGSSASTCGLRPVYGAVLDEAGYHL